MANPQIENGYTKIANELLEAISRINLSSYEFRVMMAIIRKTYGFSKKKDWISLSQLGEITGISVPHVCRSINKLKVKNMLIKNGKITGIQKDYRQWKVTQTGSTQIGSTSMGNKDKKLPKQAIKITQTGKKKLPKQADTKEIKETITKENIYSILKFWNDKKIIVHEPIEDMLNQIRIGIEKYGIKKIEIAINRYKQILDDDKFYYKHIWRLDKFLKQSNGVPNFLDDGEIWINYKGKNNYDIGVKIETDWNETKKAQLAESDRDRARDPLYDEAFKCALSKRFKCDCKTDTDICKVCNKENILKGE
jgi:phage replication O-like protein O